ncbi:unnamed protein product, partial [Diplocarpon coronariae]
FIKGYSRICRPLTALTGNVPFDFNDTCKEAWEALRSSLQTTPILCHYHPQKQTRLETDASDGFFADFNFLIMYRTGTTNTLADTLSRRDQELTPLEARKRALRHQQLLPNDKLSTEVLATRGDSTPGPGPRATSAQINSTPGPGPRVTIVPIAPIEAPADPTSRVEYDVASYHIIDEVIQANKTSPELQKKYYWKSLGSDVGTYIQNCRCSRMKARRDKTPGFLQPLPIPERAYQHLTMDFTELPLDELGYDFALTVDAKGLAELFLIHWIRHFGMPDSILSDRGAQFVSTFWNELCRILGTKVKLTTAYNPNVDGQTEIMNHRLLPLMDIAQLTLPHESLGQISPFQVLNGYEARSSWSLINPEPPRTATERVNRETALRIATRAQKVVQFAQSSLQAQQAKMKRLADLHRRPVDWTVGDDVLISTKNWKLDRPSRKLSDKWYGPVKVLEKLGESWKLQLPDSLRSIYPVFHSHSLRKYLPNPLPGQVREPPAPIKILPEQEEWEIEEIIGSRIRARKLEYQIKWKGADEDLEWYPCSDAMTAPHAIRSFHLKNPQAKGPPRALSSWLRSYNDGVDDYRDLEDNTPMDITARAQFFKRGG